MTKEQMDFIKSLDPQGIDGTISSVLLNPSLKNASFEEILKFLVKQLFREKLFLVKQNIELSEKVFKEN